MADILKAQAVILSKLNYGDTSLILDLFTKEFGKITAILKGARSPKSKIGTIADTLNLVDVVFYKKDSRDVQLISQIDLISYYSYIKENLNNLSYASAVIELTNRLTVENEKNGRLFKGIKRIFDLLNKRDEDPQLLFVKFFVFLLKEIGYELQLQRCSSCETEISFNEVYSYSFVEGLLCEKCSQNHFGLFHMEKELLKIFYGINSKLEKIEYSEYQLKRIIKFLENYITYQIPEFKGIKSLKLFD